MNDKFRSDLHDLFCNTRNVYSHYAIPQSTNKSFHQAAYQNNLNRQLNDSISNNSSNNHNNETSVNNNNDSKSSRRGEHCQGIIRSDLRSHGRHSTCASSSSGGTTSGRVARLNLRGPEGAYESTITSKLSSEKMTNSTTTATATTTTTTTMATLVAATIVTTATPSTHTTTTTKTITSFERLPLNGPTFETNKACITSDFNNQSVEPASKNKKILATRDLKDSIDIVDNKGTSKRILSDTKSAAEGGVFVKIFHRPKLAKRQVSRIYKWPPEDRIKREKKKEASEDDHQQDTSSNSKHAEEDVNEDEDNVNSDEEEEEEKEEEDEEDEEVDEEQDCSDEISRGERQFSITNV